MWDWEGFPCKDPTNGSDGKQLGRTVGATSSPVIKQAASYKD